jgi:outer membrane protein assembly factor BamE (lipoprotein component of BamABCDE complex)
MRTAVVLLVVTLFTPLLPATEKLTEQDRIELMRGLVAEYATVKQLLPRSKKALPFESSGTFDKKAWIAAAREYGPAGRVGDLVHITKVGIEPDRLVLQINGGFNGGRKWYEGAQVQGGIGGGGPARTIGNGDSNAPGGTTIEILFHKPLEPMKAAEVKKMLAPVLDFERRSATEIYAVELPAPVKKAIAEKKVLEGMDRDQVLLAMGRPTHKSRETHDGIEFEDWVFGDPPGKIVFVTFSGSKVVKVKEEYAGLGTEVGDSKTAPH